MLVHRGPYRGHGDPELGTWEPTTQPRPKASGIPTSARPVGGEHTGAHRRRFGGIRSGHMAAEPAPWAEDLALGALGAVVRSVAPDIQRYVKIREM
jgi:Family of unknown function (DUF6893)